jgi:leucyl-tRNA---protein transferase
VSTLSNLKLYATHPHACSYLDGQEATTLFIDPQAEVDHALYSHLSDLGFRRSGDHIYRPRCQTCKACIPVRIPAFQFKATRQQKRCWARNQDLRVSVSQTLNLSLYYPLYARYISERHADGDMFPPSEEQLLNFLKPAVAKSTDYLEFWLHDELIAVAVSDRLAQGLSAIYTFYSPAAEHQYRSLGVMAVLYQIARAQQLKLPYVYLGYWIKNCRKMAYKNQYRPLEMLIEQNWVQVGLE